MRIVADPSQRLKEWREKAVCSPAQGIIALGKQRWAKVKALLNKPDTPFALETGIERAVEWRRNSQMIDELRWLLDLSDDEVDDLFRVAMKIEL